MADTLSAEMASATRSSNNPLTIAWTAFKKVRPMAAGALIASGTFRTWIHNTGDKGYEELARGFGLLNLITGILIVVIGFMQLRGMSTKLPWLRLDLAHVTLAFVIANFFGLAFFCFLPIDVDGGAQFSAFLTLFQLGNKLGMLGNDGTPSPLRASTQSDRWKWGGVMALLLAAVVFVPMLNFIKIGKTNFFSGYEAGGLRLGVAFLFIVLIVSGSYGMRLAKGSPDPGPRLTWPHLSMVFGGAIAILALAWIVSAARASGITSTFANWLMVLVGVAMIGAGIAEYKAREIA